MSGKFLHGGPQRAFYGAVEMNPGLHWLFKDVRDVRTVRYMPRSASHKEWDQKERIVVIGYKAERAKLSNPFDIELRATGLDI